MKQFIITQSQEEKIENAKKLLAKLKHEYTVFSFGRIDDKTKKIIPNYKTLNRKTNEIDFSSLYQNNHLGMYMILNSFEGDQSRQPNYKQATEYKYAFFESDGVSADKFIIEERANDYTNIELPYVGVIFSGSKSFHIICRLDASNLEEFKERYAVVKNYLDKNNIAIDGSNCSPLKFCRFPFADRQGKDQYVVSVNDVDISYDEWFNVVGKNFVPRKKVFEKKYPYKADDSEWGKIKDEVIKNLTVYHTNGDGDIYNKWWFQLKHLVNAGYSFNEIYSSGLCDCEPEYLEYKITDIENHAFEDKTLARNILINDAKKHGFVMKTSDNMPQVIIYLAEKDKNGNDKKDKNNNIITKMFFDEIAFRKFVEWCGFHIYYKADKLLWVKIENDAFVSKVDIKQVKNDVMLKLQEILKPNEFVFASKQLKNNELFSSYKPIEIKTIRDEIDKIRFFFKNCVVEVGKYEINEIPYFQLDGYIWKDTIKSINYDYDSSIKIEANGFYRFVRDITSDFDDNGELKPNKDKFLSLCSALGYLISTHRKRSDAKAVYITDDKSSFMDEDISTGRTGKGILCQALEEVRYIGEKDCKSISTDRFGLSMWREGMTNVIFSDIQPTFKFKSLYNIITDSIQIELKGENIFNIPFEEGFKTIITANHVIGDLGDESSKGRLFIAAITNLFNADSGNNPISRYKQVFFSQDWSAEERQAFYVFMINCARLYLKKGLIEYNNSKLQAKINIAGIKNNGFLKWASIWAKENKDKLDGNFKWKMIELYESYSTANTLANGARKDYFIEKLSLFVDYVKKFFNLTEDNNKIKVHGINFWVINLENCPNVKEYIQQNEEDTTYLDEETVEETENYDISCPI